MDDKTIVMAADHAGYQMKEYIKKQLVQEGYSPVDYGTDSDESVDYPDFAHKVGEAIESGAYSRGLVFCGSGNGVNMTVNNGVETRAVKTKWAAGDKIYVTFDVCFPAELDSHLTLTYNGFSWTSEFSDDTIEGLLTEKGTGKLAAAFISADRKPEFQYMPAPANNPYVPSITMTNSDGLTGVFLATDDVTYTVEDGTLTAELNMAVRVNNAVHFSLEGIPTGEAGNFTLCCDKLVPAHFNRFTYVLIDIPESSYHLEIGPWTDYVLGKAGEPIPGQYFDGAVEFNCALDTPVVGSETEFVFYIVNNNGTPNDASDDTTYSLTKTTTINDKDAIRFPWLNNTQEWIVLTPSDITPVFNGYNDEVIW